MNEPATRRRAIAWRFPTHDENDMRLSAPMTWYGWLSVYARRWQYAPPWGCTRWWLPAVHYYRGGDEYCNNTLLVQLPLLGHVVLWKPWGRLRTTICDECMAKEREEASEYMAAVKAPLSPAAIEALVAALKAGTVPTRKVRRRTDA